MKRTAENFQLIGVAFMPISCMLMFSSLFDANAIVQRPLAIALLLAGNVILLSDAPSKNIIFIAFQALFFLFFVSGPLLDGFDGVNYFREFTQTIVDSTYLCYWIAAAAMWTYCVYRLYCPDGIEFSIGRRETCAVDYYAEKYDFDRIRFYALIAFYISMAAYVLVIFEKVMFRQSFTMSDYYAAYAASSDLPTIIVKISDCHQIALCLFLATKPTKKQAKTPLIIFLSVSGLTVMYGVRNVILLNLVFVVIYRILRHSEGEEIWFTKKSGIFLIMIVPFMMIFMQAFAMIRGYAGFNLLQIRGLLSLSRVREFFAAQSVSSKILPNAMAYASKLGGQPVPYTLGTLYTYLRQNMITRLFTGASAMNSNSVASAMDGANLGSRLAYCMYRESFLAGTGMGGNFVADLFVDFSYFGVFAGTWTACTFINKMTKSVTGGGSRPLPWRLC